MPLDSRAVRASRWMGPCGKGMELNRMLPIDIRTILGQSHTLKMFPE